MTHTDETLGESPNLLASLQEPEAVEGASAATDDWAAAEAPELAYAPTGHVEDGADEGAPDQAPQVAVLVNAQGEDSAEEGGPVQARARL